MIIKVNVTQYVSKIVLMQVLPNETTISAYQHINPLRNGNNNVLHSYRIQIERKNALKNVTPQI